MLPPAILTLIFLVLSGLLWSQRPSPTLWLLGSLALGVGWGVVFLRLIANKAESGAE